jgi:ADP-ribose pyrophosphatase YjhB (NUDIX family)
MRRAKVVGFSVPPEIHQKLERLIKKEHKTKSEFFRDILDVYFKTVKLGSTDNHPVKIQEKDLAKILRNYWTLRSTSSMEIIIIGLGIIVSESKKVLIGARKNKDHWVENLTWVFPGGKLTSLDFAEETQREIKEETGLEVTVKNLVAARIHPDSGFKPVQIVALYFHCEPANQKRPKPGGDLVKLKWVRPTEVFKYFTTSTCDEVTKFLVTIEKANF